MNIGIISDTHGLIRPDALAALKDSELIIHAGDIGSASVLQALEEIAPVVAVRGNCDTEAWSYALPESEFLHAGPEMIFVVHDSDTIDFDPDSAGIAAVITGHSHKATVVRKGKTVYLNPGSAGPRRFKLPVTVARMSVVSGEVKADIIVLES